MKRLLAHGAALFFLLCLSLATALYWLAATEPGLRWLAAEVGALVPSVDVERAEGTLLGGFALHGLAYKDETTDVHLDALDLRWEPADLWRGVLHFRSIEMAGLRIVSTGESSSEPLAWPKWTLPLELAIDDFQLKEASLQTSAEGKPIRIDRLDTALRVGAEGLRIDRLSLAMPEAVAEMSGRVGFSGARRVDVKTGWTVTLPDRPEFKGTGSVLGDAQRLILRQTLQAPLPAELTVVLADPLNKPAWTAQVDVPKFSPNRIDKAWKPWPVTLSLQGQGTLAEASIGGNFLAEIPEAGEANGRLQVRWRAPGDVVIETLNLALPRTGTEFGLGGSVRKLDTNPEFDLSANWRNLMWPPDPKAEWRSPEGKLTVVGNLKDIRFDLAGKLRDLPVEAAGNIGLEPGRTVFRGVRVRGAGTEAALDGILGPRLDFAWTLRAEDLGLWLPGAKGRVDSRGTLQGTREAPAVDAELFARDLRYEDNGVRDLRLNLKAGIQPDSPFAFSLSAADLNAAGYTLDAELAGQGTRAAHRLTGRIKGLIPVEGKGPVAAALDFGADGGLRGETWAGHLVRFDFDAAPLGRWDLQRPAALKLARTGGELGWACWGSQGADWCLQATVGSGGEWQFATELSDLPVARFKATLPEAVSVAGVLHAKAQFSGKGGQVGEGWLDLRAADALLEYRANDKNILRFKPEPLSVHLQVSGRGSRLDLVAEHAGLASIRGHLALAGPPDPSRLMRLPLDGDLQADLQNLAILEPFATDIENLKGSFHADLRVVGTAAAPVLQLHAGVPDGEFGVPKLGIKVGGVKLEAVTREENQITLRGRAVSGKGEVRLDGTATLSEAAGWPLSLTLKGTRFLAADIPEARVFVSPDLGMALEEGRLLLKGRLGVPEASIRVPEQTGAVKPSEDVVLVGAEAPPEKAALPIETRVDVVLGDKVKVQAAGFKGRLDGHVLVEQNPRGPVLGTGQIMIREGKYGLYGVELDINDGRILFAHSPVDNPGLDINVTRKTDDVLAGVKVLGTVKKPSINLYADRPMSQTDILAYLVTGKPLGLASKEEGSLLQGAAASLGGSAGGFLAKEIGSRLGLADFVDISVQSSLESQGISRSYHAAAAGGATASGSQSTALFLGKYLTPRLYVQYGMGLFQNAYVFRVRYELSKHWKIQTETGEYSGGDILYQWEK
jgi:translocation and assembly module TamB